MAVAEKCKILYKMTKRRQQMLAAFFNMSKDQS